MKDRVYNEKHILNFLRTCVSVLEVGDEFASAAAFYFEQIEDHIKQGGTLPQDYKDIQRMFGL